MDLLFGGGSSGEEDEIPASSTPGSTPTEAGAGPQPYRFEPAQKRKVNISSGLQPDETAMDVEESRSGNNE